MEPLMLRSWPRAIAHIDADAFFASVEQSIHPELKGLPVITGAERGIVASASYEAKALGIQRGVSLRDVKKIAPQCVLIPSDYETYSLYSKRIFSIIRRFTPDIEEYSIDEAFADITGLRNLYRCSYKEIAQKIQKTIHRELDITVSVGISLSKSLAKIASKWQKPHGLTTIPGRLIHEFLVKTPIPTVWGFGENITHFLEKKGVTHAYQFISKPKEMVKSWLGKKGVEIWEELRGEAVYSIDTAPKTTYASICKSKTFSPPTSDAKAVYARLLRNLESACIKVRRYGLGAKELSIYVKRQDFQTYGYRLALSRAEDSPLILNKFLRIAFDKAFRHGILYRSTGVVLGKLQELGPTQFNLFEDPVSIIDRSTVFKSIDDINKRFGKHTVFLSPGLDIKKQFDGTRGRVPSRKKTLLKSENKRQRLGLPLLKYKGV